MSGERGVSSVVGVVLILGITVAVVMVMLAIGTVALEQSRDDTRLTQMETSMAQMSSKASLAALGDVTSQSFDVGELGDGTLEVRETKGSVTIEMEPLDEEEELIEIYHTDSFGALVYALDDREVAYQGGGVWKRTGNNGGHMVSPPEYHYLSETLTFPIVRIVGDDVSQHRGSGQVSHETTATHFPDEDLQNPVEDATIYIEIESMYHRGWYTFFQSRTEGEIEYDPGSETVRTELTAIFEEGFQRSVAVQDHYDVHQHTDDDDFQEGVRYPSPTSAIEQETDECDIENGDEPFDPEESSFTGGVTYCADEHVELDQDITFETDGEDIDVVLAKGIDFSGEDVTIKGDGTVSFYVKESVEFGNGDFNIDGNPSQQFFYVHSEANTIDESGDFNLHGVLYAPNVNVEFSGNVEIIGSVIANVFESKGNAASYEFDESLSDTDLGFDPSLDELRFLHVTENTIRIILDG